MLILMQKLSNFVPPTWKLHNPYCHSFHLSQFVLGLAHWAFFTKSVSFACFYKAKNPFNVIMYSNTKLLFMYSLTMQFNGFDPNNSTLLLYHFLLIVKIFFYLWMLTLAQICCNFSSFYSKEMLKKENHDIC